MIDYADYPSYEDFVQYEFFPVRCLDAHHYWVSFKNGPTQYATTSELWPYYAKGKIFPGGGGFTKPKNIDWPFISKFQYEQTQPILCCNEYNEWSWFSQYKPLFKDLGYEEAETLIYKLGVPDNG